MNQRTISKQFLILRDDRDMSKLQTLLSPLYVYLKQRKRATVYARLALSLRKGSVFKHPTIMQMSDVTPALPPLSFNLEVKAHAKHQHHRISILHDFTYLYIKSTRWWLHAIHSLTVHMRAYISPFPILCEDNACQIQSYCSPFMFISNKEKGRRYRCVYVYLSTWWSAWVCHRRCPSDVPYPSSVATIGCTWSTMQSQKNCRTIFFQSSLASSVFLIDLYVTQVSM